MPADDTPPPHPHGSTPVRAWHGVMMAALLAALAACSATTSEAADTTAVTSTTVAPTTSSSTSTSTSTSTTSTLPPLPVPAAPPDPRAPEPEVVLGTIEIPAIDVTRTLYEGVSLTTLDRGPGHWPGTALPGSYGNVVVGGHRTSHDRPFYDLDELKTGDEIVYTTDEGRFVYVVTDVIIVSPLDIWIIDQKPGYTTTLFACHPPGSTRQRIVVQATLQGA